MPRPHPDIVRSLMALGRAGIAAIPRELADSEHAWHALMCGNEPWDELGRELSDAELGELIRGLVLYSQARLGGTDGSVSPVIVLYRRYVKRFPATEPALTAWIVDHRTNAYEPFGTMRHFEVRSLAEFQRRAAEAAVDKARRQQLQQETQQRQRQVQHSTVATARLAVAVRRGDLGAVQALLARGAEPTRALPSGQSLVALALEHGRQAVADYLKQLGIP